MLIKNENVGGMNISEIMRASFCLFNLLTKFFRFDVFSLLPDICKYD